MNDKWLFGIALLLAIYMLANGAFMTLMPEAWYQAVPGVADRGPYNHHFIRDIGILYLLIGAAYAAGIHFAGQRAVLWLMPTLWLAGHGIFHLWEVWAGHTGLGAIAQDFVGVTLPVLLGAWLVVTARQTRS